MTSLYYLNAALPQDIQAKLEATDLFKPVTPLIQTDAYTADGFYADCTPKTIAPEILYPCFASWYLSVPIPSTNLQIHQHYRQTASVAAIQWLEKMLPDAVTDVRHFDGEYVTGTVNGTDLTCCFPTLSIRYNQVISGKAEYAAIIPWPDVMDNKDDWGDAWTPYYVEAQARLLLWCWKQSQLLGRRTQVPDHVFVVRISGNTPSEVTVRLIRDDPKAEQVFLRRLVMAKNNAAKKGENLLKSVKIRDQGTWLERKQAERETAFLCEDADFYELVQRYMTIRSARKTKEDEADAIKNEMDAIAIAAISETDTDTMTGFLSDPVSGQSFSVTHSKSRTSAAHPTPGIVREFAPQHINAIYTQIIPKGAITIEGC